MSEDPEVQHGALSNVDFQGPACTLAMVPKVEHERTCAAAALLVYAFWRHRQDAGLRIRFDASTQFVSRRASWSCRCYQWGAASLGQAGQRHRKRQPHVSRQDTGVGKVEGAYDWLSMGALQGPPLGPPPAGQSDVEWESDDDDDDDDETRWLTAG